ncbi:peptide ABC transporter permease [Herbiconiux sp. L3-i23]|nr:peptide ABC transporter permease [Herbiconiux sp. L3-i23]
MRWALAPIAAVGVISMLAACASGDSGDTADSGDMTSARDTLIFAIKEDPTCIDPQQSTITTSLNIGRQVVDSLVDQDPETGEIVPWLATEFTSSDDLTSYTFTLRDDVTFSDDTALTPEVVKANFDALFALSSTASLASQYLAGYESTEVVDDSTVTVNFSAPNVQFLQGASTMTLGLVSEASTAASAEERCTVGVIGSGPFVFDSYTPNDSVVITKRAGYDFASELRGHQGEALVDTIEFPIITENGNRTGGLESGEYDIIQDLPYADEARFDTDDFRLYSKANTGVPTGLIPNIDHSPVVADEAVRKALILGTDRDEIKELTAAAAANPATSALTSSTTGFVSQEDALAYDPDAAEELLEDAGWTLGSDGVREKDGQKLTFTVTAFYAQDVLEVAQMQLKDIGVDMQINITDAGGFFGAIASGDYDFLSAGLTRTDPDALRTLFSQAAKSKWAIIDDAELEALLTEQASTSDVDARMELIAEAQALIIENADFVPLVETIQLHASGASIEGITFDSASRINLYDVRATS